MWKAPKVVAIVMAGGENFPYRLSCAEALTEFVYVADARGVVRHSPREYATPPFRGEPHYRWSLQVARRMYDHSRAGDTVYTFGFPSRAWISSLRLLRRNVHEIRLGRGERSELAYLEQKARQVKLFGGAA